MSLTKSDTEVAKLVAGVDKPAPLSRWKPRPTEQGWWQTRQDRDALAERLLRLFADKGPSNARDQARRRGLTKVLDWLERHPGDSWQDRWLASGADAAGFDWADLPLQGIAKPRNYHRDELNSGVTMLVAGQAVRPGYRWLLRQRQVLMLAEARSAIDPDGFARVERHTGQAARYARSDALNKLTWIVISKGGVVADITVGDCIELTEALQQHHFRGSAGRPLFYALLKEAGVLHGNAPSRLRELRLHGRRSVEQIVDAYGIQCRPIRNLLIEYLTERSPELDHTSLRSVARNLCRLFWRDLEIHRPGIDSLKLAPEVAQAWKERLAHIRDADGNPLRPRENYRGELVFVRAFYEDIARWAADDPARWAQWVAPCPIKASEVTRKKTQARVKARMDQRTRTQLPLLPALLRAVEQQRKEATERVQAARDTPSEGQFTAVGQQFQRCRQGDSGRVFAIDSTTGSRRDLTFEEEAAFWSWATVEVLRHTGIRIEEMLELTHHSFVAYTLPTTGEVVPMLQIAPSKTDAERLLLVSAELAEVLTAIIFRVRAGNAALPLVPAYDVFEQTWSPPMPYLFQRRFGTEDRPLTRSYIRECLVTMSQTAQVTAAGQPLQWRPHDFRRIFVTDAIRSGLPPHIAAKVCGHATVDTTMGYAAIYPEDVISHHRAFIARRRAERPSEEYRDLTATEWDQFLAHFELRKVALGICGRDHGTPCQHENACVRCPLLRVDPTQQPRLEQIHANLADRLDEAREQGWMGEVAAIETTMAAAAQKLEAMRTARDKPVHLGMPDVHLSVGRRA
ncbi:site-specific integrase [Amycolatopsis sp. DG1A-15b]|uniref:site-specific integrase n=1 Tax=Amycolatopsis sp. DG1A-15b TaxID=3052846 RepID=UPI00255B534A|nr:site-specific integrase [Amycolatopsis sp. DG1A-15b]WIX85717.1 site-specific integrase [Amycolatopsis sp. DG1A-15b]